VGTAGRGVAGVREVDGGAALDEDGGVVSGGGKGGGRDSMTVAGGSGDRELPAPITGAAPDVDDAGDVAGTDGGVDGAIGTETAVVTAGVCTKVSSIFVVSDLVSSFAVSGLPACLVVPTPAAGVFPAAFPSDEAVSGRSVFRPRRAFSRFRASMIRAICASTSACVGSFASLVC
jgi:hypothetical protein